MTPLATAFAESGTAPTAQTQPDRQGRHGEHRRLAKAALKDAAGVIGVSSQDLASALKTGQSVADVATAHGVDPQTVVDKLVADASAKIDEAVASGKLSADKATTIKTKLPDHVSKLVNKRFDGSHRHGGDRAKAAGQN